MSGDFLSLSMSGRRWQTRAPSFMIEISPIVSISRYIHRVIGYAIIRILRQPDVKIQLPISSYTYPTEGKVSPPGVNLVINLEFWKCKENYGFSHATMHALKRIMTSSLYQQPNKFSTQSLIPIVRNYYVQLRVCAP